MSDGISDAGGFCSCGPDDDDVDAARETMRKASAAAVQTCALQCCIDLFERAAERDGFDVTRYGLCSVGRNRDSMIVMVAVGALKGMKVDDVLSSIRAELCRYQDNRRQTVDDPL